jgi:hypothetical protein
MTARKGTVSAADSSFFTNIISNSYWNSGLKPAVAASFSRTSRTLRLTARRADAPLSAIAAPSSAGLEILIFSRPQAP